MNSRLKGIVTVILIVIIGLVGGRVLPVEGGEGFRQTGIDDGLCDINHGGDLLVCHG